MGDFLARRDAVSFQQWKLIILYLNSGIFFIFLMIFSVCLQVILCIKIKFAIYLYILQHFMLDLQCIYIILIFISILLLFCVYLYYIFEGECSLCFILWFFLSFSWCVRT